MTVETRAKATPGPWRDIGRGYIVHDEHGIEHHVAQVFNRPADVTLITAAPAMLAALERIASEGRYEPTEDELEGEDKGHFLQMLGRWDAGETARAAILAARGEA